MTLTRLPYFTKSKTLANAEAYLTERDSRSD